MGMRTGSRKSQEVSLDVGNPGDVHKNALGWAAVALVAGLLNGRLAAALRYADGVGALAQQPPRAVHGVGVVAVETGRLPHTHIVGQVAQAGRVVAVNLVGDADVGVRGLRPGNPELVVAGQAHGVGTGAEAAAGGRRRLQAIE
jgi:hypothetical protein